MAKIGEKTLNQISEDFTTLLNDHKEKLFKAYEDATQEDGPGGLDVYVKIKLKPAKKDQAGNAVNTSINFVPERVKDSVSSTVDEQQESLPGI